MSGWRKVDIGIDDDGNILYSVDGDATEHKLENKIGGSVPGSVRLLDLGVVDAALVADGPVTLYTPAAGELVGPVLLRDPVFVDSCAISIIGDPVSPTVSPLAAWDTDLSGDGFWGEGPLSVDANAVAPTTTGPVTAAATASVGAGASAPWQANTPYDGSAATVFILGSDEHFWSTADDGTSGPTEPDFAGNEGGDVLDNDITWTDQGAMPTSGSAHVYAYSSVPVAP